MCFFFWQNFHHAPSFFFAETWSLAIEEWFYLLFAFFLWSALILFRRSRLAWVLVIGAFLVIPAILRGAAIVRLSADGVDALESFRHVWDSSMRRTVILRLDVVMYGVVAALIAACRPRWWQRAAKLWPVGLALIAAATTSIALNAPLDRGRAIDGFLLWPCLALGFAFLLPQFSLWPNREGWWADSARLVARLSYALYLCHGLVLIVLWRFFARGSLWPLPKQSVSLCVVAWFFSFAVAWVVYRWFEKPFMDYRQRYETAAATQDAKTMP